MIRSETYNSVGGGFGAIASAFVVESLQHMVVWLLVMTMVVFCDLITGIAKSVKLGIKVRFSKAIRDGMGKFCTYYAVVVCACMTQVASGSDFDIEKYTCWFIIAIEGISVAGNILRMKGYDIDFNKLIAFVIGKRFDVTTKEAEGIITKKDEK